MKFYRAEPRVAVPSRTRPSLAAPRSASDILVRCQNYSAKSDKLKQRHRTHFRPIGFERQQRYRERGRTLSEYGYAPGWPTPERFLWKRRSVA